MTAAQSPEPVTKLAAASAQRHMGAPVRGDMPARIRTPRSTTLRHSAEPRGLRLLQQNLPTGPSGAGGGDGQPGEPMAARARRWAEAAAPPAARASGRGAGPRHWLLGPAGVLGFRDPGRSAGAWEHGSGVQNPSQRFVHRT
ncbi:hypothetical protein PAL_GLEAN10024849 [Pteropus alecto]|uniref:Uncharacterized protein n=1 Tax=Pteropus alecto TaxID=9402 RepID=L5KIL8_PTEAL|nr:hypothetical protein PAL_GLEAN10024849 [Pteropus alecto]